MRIIGGQFKSRQLKTTALAGTRPTSDRLRETLFNILAPQIGGASVFDGYAGFGAIGLEALSRGAAHVVFAEQSSRACKMIRSNLNALDVTGGIELLSMDVAKALQICARNDLRFDIVFLDPPYDRADLQLRDMELIVKRNLLADSGILVIEHATRTGLPPAPAPLERYRTLRQGDATLSFHRMEAA